MNHTVPPSDPTFFDEQKRAWAAPPVDGVGYLDSASLLRKSDDELREMIRRMSQERYAVDGWRNHENKWRQLLGLDATTGKRVLDYGCGVGLEALQFARRGNTVYAGDIVQENALLAERVARLHGHRVDPVLLDTSSPFFRDEQVDFAIDVFYCNGVLHHTPLARQILERAARVLAPDGEIRLMLYSDKCWELTTSTPAPPVDEDVATHPSFHKFLRNMDYVGGYADWYSKEKIEHRFGDFLDLVDFQYITSDNAFCVAILEKRSAP